MGAADASQGTPLHNAAYAGHREALLALLAAKADVNASDEAGNSPLHLAMHQVCGFCGGLASAWLRLASLVSAFGRYSRKEIAAKCCSLAARIRLCATRKA